MKRCKKRRRKNTFIYKDSKYVRAACGYAYNGILMAQDTYLLLKDVPLPRKPKRKSIEFYQANLAKLDKKLAVGVINAYEILHIDGYYDGVTDVGVIQSGLNIADRIIGRIQPSLN